jgi:hypothetical protein
MISWKNPSLIEKMSHNEGKIRQIMSQSKSMT